MDCMFHKRWGLVAAILLWSGSLIWGATGCLKPDYSKACGPDEPPCFKGETCYEGTCQPTDEVPLTEADADQDDAKPDGTDTSDTTPPPDVPDAADSGLDDSGLDTGDAHDSTEMDTGSDTKYVTEDADGESTDTCAFIPQRTGVCAAYHLSPYESCDPPPSFTETETAQHCDGLDNDCDGVIDERCNCNPGNQKRCYTGPGWARGEGACENTGYQSCNSDGQWGLCKGENILPAREDCSNQRDDDCDGDLPSEDPDCR